jgi:hypothetical protein
MSKINDGGPAFPHAHEDYPFQHGMSLRDWFAGQALAGILANPALTDVEEAEWCAVYATECADAMLKAREVKP